MKLQKTVAATHPPAGDLLVPHQLVSPSPRQGGHLPHLALPHRPPPHRVAEAERRGEDGVIYSRRCSSGEHLSRHAVFPYFVPKVSGSSKLFD